MAITRVQSVAASAQFTATRTITVAATGAGNTLILVLEHQSSAAPSVSDNAGNTWSRTSSSLTAGATGQYQLDIWTASAAAASATTVTVTTVTNGSVLGTVFYEVSGAGTVRATAASTATTANGVNTLPTPLGLDIRPGDFAVSAVSYFANSSDETVSSPWVPTGSGISTTRFASSSQLATSAQSTGPQWTLPTVKNGWAQTGVIYTPAEVTAPAYSASVSVSGSGTSTSGSAVSFSTAVTSSGSGGAAQASTPAMSSQATSAASGSSSATAISSFTVSVAPTGTGSADGVALVAIRSAGSSRGFGESEAEGSPTFTARASASGFSTSTTRVTLALTGSGLASGEGTSTATGLSLAALRPRRVAVTTPRTGASIFIQSRSRTEVRVP